MCEEKRLAYRVDELEEKLQQNFTVTRLQIV